MTSQVITNRAGYSRPAEIFAWAMYDWANSAYSTVSITILVKYIQHGVFPEETYGKTTGAVIWAWGIAASMFLSAILSPVTGAVADANASKRKWLASTALGGAAAAIGLGLVPPDWPWLVVAFFFLTSLLFELSLGFYNAFLPEIADDRTMNRVSAWGFALGYLGGALPLVLAVGLFTLGDRVGIHGSLNQARVGLVIMGLWWGIFTLPAIRILRDRNAPPEQKTTTIQAGRQAIRQVLGTIQNVRRFKMLALFLLAFLFFNDGVQTVISQASTFAIQELDFTQNDLIGLILMIQFLAIPGSLLVGWLGDHLGQKPTLVLCLAVWVGLLTSAFFVHSKLPFWILGAVLAMVMGGVQSVSRAIMGMMTPERNSAEFFGFFNLSGKATGIFGTFLFGLTILLTHSPRYAIVSLLVLFLLGWALMTRVDIGEGRRQALDANAS